MAHCYPPVPHSPAWPQCASRGCHMPTCTTYPLSPGPRTYLLRRSHLLPPLCPSPASVFARASARGASAIFCTREAPLPVWTPLALPFSDFTILCPGLPHRCPEVVLQLVSPNNKGYHSLSQNRAACAVAVPQISVVSSLAGGALLQLP